MPRFAQDSGKTRLGGCQSNLACRRGEDTSAASQAFLRVRRRQARLRMPDLLRMARGYYFYHGGLPLAIPRNHRTQVLGDQPIELGGRDHHPGAQFV